MESIPRKSLAESVAKELGKHLDDGSLSGMLPGVRLLSKSLNVSVPTVCRALHLLAEQGKVSPGGGKRRWRACVSPAKTRSPVEDATPTATPLVLSSGRVLLLTSQALSEERHVGIEIISELLDQLKRKGWEVMHRTVHFKTAKKPRRSWDDLLKLTQPDTLVVIGGTLPVAGWATGHGIRTLFVGGESGDCKIPVLAIRVSAMFRYSLDRLLATGHKRVLMPLCERSPEYAIRCREIAAECTAAGGLDRNSVVIADTPYSGPQVIVDLLTQQWKKQAPDALIFLDWREYVAASSFLARRGLMIPRDLSVVILSQNVNMTWHLPTISHFEHPSKALARGISNWVLMKGKLGSGHESFKEIRARWIEGESVIQRK